MAKLSLPIPSQVPLDVLGTRIDTILDRVPKEGRYGSAIVTRFANVCEGHGIETVWMLTVYRGTRFGKFKNAGPGTVALAEETLEDVRCTFDAFPQLRGALEDACVNADLRRLHIDFEQLLMALAGIGDWAKEPAIIAALAEHGLRPGMPLEELFVYVSVVTEPKKLTVAEELLAFGRKTMAELAKKERELGGPPSDSNPFITTGDFALGLRTTGDTTMIEIMYFFATLPRQFSGNTPDTRNVFLRWARMELSDEAFAGIMNMNK